MQGNGLCAPSTKQWGFNDHQCVTTLMSLGFTFILGVDGIKALGGVTVDYQCGVRFGIDETDLCSRGHSEGY